MEEYSSPSIAAQRNNLERYCRLLATQLTDLERDYIHRRIMEVHAAIRVLTGGDSSGLPDGVAASGG